VHESFAERKICSGSEVNQSDCNFPIATSYSLKEEALNEIQCGSSYVYIYIYIYIYCIRVPSVNLHMNYTQQKAVYKQQPDQMAAHGVWLLWGRGRNYGTRSE